MINLAQKLGLSENVISRLEKLNKEQVEALSESCVKSGFNILKTKNRFIRLAVILNLAVRVKEKYDEYGIDEKIYYDTMFDIRIWCERCGNRGLENYGWLKNHVSFELFRLGRLQFQLYECKNKTLLYKKLPFGYGEKLVYIHIPEGEKLQKDKCIDAIEKSKEFFGEYFSEYDYGYYFCESWLLFEGNRNFMSQNSNIVNFMSLFNICYSVKVDKQAIERIYGKRRLFIKNYPEDTSLQKQAKAYMKSGNLLGIGIGVIKK